MAYAYDSHGWFTTEPLSGRVTDVAPPAHISDIGVGELWPNWTGTEWILAPYAEPPPAPEEPEDPTKWLLDLGPFCDRFGAAKMAVLTSANPTVQAIMRDFGWRKWIDLKHPDVAAALDALIALGVTGINASLKNAILTTPATDEENLALRRLYFS